jgi:signal transduction histidine kinase
MINEFGLYTSKVIHEIANHLNGMLLCVQMLQRDIKTRPDVDRTLNMIEELMSEIGNLRSLLDDLHKMNQPLKLDCLSVGLSALLDAVLGKIFPPPVRHRVQVCKDFSENLSPVMADPKKLQQVFINLVKNAVEAMPHGGYLRLRGYEDGDYVCCEIEDTGVGIPKDLRIFEPFATSKPKGVGLGLCIAREIMIAHHGKIDYISAVGNGTTFKISLPPAEGLKA